MKEAAPLSSGFQRRAFGGVQRQGLWPCLLLLTIATPTRATTPRFGEAPNSLLPGVGPADPRRPADVAVAPWRGVVRVQTELGTRCTGFLVGPATVITAAHCLYAYNPRAFIQPGSVHVLTGYTVAHYDGHARVSAYHVAPGYDPLDETRTAAADWAILTLASPLATPDRLLRLAPAPPPVGTDVTLGGYGQDREEQLTADPHCRITAIQTDAGGHPLLRHSCAATRGTSGAPLLARDSDGAWHVLGVQVAADARGTGGVAAPLTASQ